MNLTITDGIFDVVAGLLAASKLVPAATPVWNKLPSWLQPILPVAVLNVPLALASFALAPTQSSWLTAGVASLMLFLPGLKHAEAGVVKAVGSAVSTVENAATAVANVVKKA